MAQGSWEVKKEFKGMKYHPNRFCENLKMLSSHVSIFWFFQSIPKMSGLEQYKSEYNRLRIRWLWHCFVVCGWRHFFKSLKSQKNLTCDIKFLKLSQNWFWIYLTHLNVFYTSHEACAIDSQHSTRIFTIFMKCNKARDQQGFFK